jgi:hypothetical protein
LHRLEHIRIIDLSGWPNGVAVTILIFVHGHMIRRTMGLFNQWVSDMTANKLARLAVATPHMLTRRDLT